MELEKEFHDRGVNVEENISCILEHISEKDKFCQEWWATQKRLQCTDKKYNRRYPPSIVRYFLVNVVYHEVEYTAHYNLALFLTDTA